MKREYIDGQYEIGNSEGKYQEKQKTTQYSRVFKYHLYRIRY